MNTNNTEFLDRDCKDIDRDLLGVSSLKAKDILKPDTNVAPAQGSPFLDKLTTATNILRRFDIRYRD